MNIGNWLELALAIWALVVVPRGIWRAWTRPKHQDEPAVVDLAQRRQPASWSIRGELARLFLVNDGPVDMSSVSTESAPYTPVAEQLPATSTNDGQRIAMQGNAVKVELPGNVLPEEAREIIRYQAKVEALAALLTAGKVPQTEGIELVFNCKRSGRADSPYGKARAAVVAQLGADKPEYRTLDEAHRTALQLDQVKR